MCDKTIGSTLKNIFCALTLGSNLTMFAKRPFKVAVDTDPFEMKQLAKSSSDGIFRFLIDDSFEDTCG
jgi:hypothetical protein